MSQDVSWVTRYEDILSERAKNVLLISGVTKTTFISLSKAAIQRWRNCGIKTRDELARLQELIRLQEPALSLSVPAAQDRKGISRRLNHLFEDFHKPELNFLSEFGYSHDSPMEWDLMIALERFSVYSQALQRLAKYKVEWYLENSFGVENADPNSYAKLFHERQLKEVFLQFHDLPFAAVICGLDIRYASNVLRDYIRVFPKIGVKNFQGIKEELDYLLGDKERDRKIIVRRLLPWGW